MWLKPPSPRPFQDRRAAGRRLAAALTAYHRHPDALVLALPRGGVPVGYEVARALELPLDLFLVRKLGVPGHEELAMGAIALGGVRVFNEQVVRALDLDPVTIAQVTAQEQQELARRAQLYRGDRPPLEVRGKSVLLVDDGLATGATMRAAALALRQLAPARLVIAVPTGSRDTCEELAALADELHCLIQPEPFQAVGLWYEDFAQTTDSEVQRLMAHFPPP